MSPAEARGALTDIDELLVVKRHPQFARISRRRRIGGTDQHQLVSICEAVIGHRRTCRSNILRRDASLELNQVISRFEVSEV